MTHWVMIFFAWRLLLQGVGVPPENIYNRGIELFWQGNPAAAEKLFVQAAPALAQTARAYFNAGNAAFMQAHFTDALRYFELALEYQPDDEDTWHNLELTRKKLGSEITAPAEDKPEKRPKGLTGVGFNRRSPSQAPPVPKHPLKPEQGFTDEEIEQILQDAQSREFRFAHYFQPRPVQPNDARARDVFTMSPDELLKYMREQTEAGYPYRPHRSKVNERRIDDAVDW